MALGFVDILGILGERLKLLRTKRRIYILFFIMTRAGCGEGSVGNVLAAQT